MTGTKERVWPECGTWSWVGQDSGRGSRGGCSQLRPCGTAPLLEAGDRAEPVAGGESGHRERGQGSTNVSKFCCPHSSLTCAAEAAVLRPPPGCRPTGPSPHGWQVTSRKDPLGKALSISRVAPALPGRPSGAPRSEDSQGLRRLLRPGPALALGLSPAGSGWWLIPSASLPLWGRVQGHLIRAFPEVSTLLPLCRGTLLSLKCISAQLLILDSCVCLFAACLWPDSPGSRTMRAVSSAPWTWPALRVQTP